MSLRTVFLLILAIMIGMTTASCGNKRRLKSPSQIAAEEQKKAHKEAKTKAKSSKPAQKTDEIAPGPQPMPPVTPGDKDEVSGADEALEAVPEK